MPEIKEEKSSSQIFPEAKNEFDAKRVPLVMTSQKVSLTPRLHEKFLFEKNMFSN